MPNQPSLYRAPEPKWLRTTKDNQPDLSITEGISRGRYMTVIIRICATMTMMASSDGDCIGLLLCFISKGYLMRLSHIFWSRSSTARVATKACSFHPSLSLDRCGLTTKTKKINPSSSSCSCGCASIGATRAVKPNSRVTIAKIPGIRRT